MRCAVQRLLISALLCTMLTPMAFAQDVAAIDPTIATPGIAAVVSTCEPLADPENTAAVPGVCLSATQAFLTGNSTLPEAEFNQSITDLVLGLAPLVADPAACAAAGTEVAEAIRLASSYSTDPAQVEQLISIAATVEACEVERTAALPGAPLAALPADDAGEPDPAATAAGPA